VTTPWGLRALVREALGVDRADLGDERVGGVAQALDRVGPGSVFIARVGRRLDAHTLIPAAIAAGALCVVGTRALGEAAPGIPYVRVADDRLATSALAATFHRHPSRALRTVGVTGTDGKTTTSTMLHHLLLDDEGGAADAGLLGTTGVLIGRAPRTLPGHFTTPEATEIHELLAEMLHAGLRSVVVESSSHGFALKRLEHVHYDVGVWTTFSPDHLDDHGTLEAYREAKRTLVRRAAVSILNRDDPSFEAFAAVARRVVAYGADPRADVRAEGVIATPAGIEFELVPPDAPPLPVRLPMVGTFNVGNALAALAAAHELGTPWRVAARRLASFGGVPGRMQLVATSPFAVVVDFAHTGPALEKALGALTPAPGGRCVVVIGAAGERDPGRRPALAAAAVDGADLAVFTEEDHRGEALEHILATMASAARERGAREGAHFLVVPDRREAIRAAFARARPGDVVLLSGKGHERTLERGDVVLPWDEVAEARAALTAIAAAERSGGDAARPLT
jgi:UDP-N-acetylmuramoyl-L-alanyl-D-glutamate--2,6-diaminopimelate ligase